MTNLYFLNLENMGRKVRTPVMTFCQYVKNSSETEPGIRNTEKVDHDRFTFFGQFQSPEKVPQKINRPEFIEG